MLTTATRTPMVAGASDRKGVPTASPNNSLINQSRVAAAPLGFSFKDPQRVIALRFGQAGLTNGPAERTRVALEAFDQRNLSMGIVAKNIPPAAAGITGWMIVAAIFPGQLIRRVEVRYEFALVAEPTRNNPLLAEPVQIDDLEYCGRLDDRGIKPKFPPSPKFGDLSVALKIKSEALLELPGSGEPGNTIPFRNSFTGLSFQVDGAPANTDSVLVRPEGTTVKLKAPVSSGIGPFLYWRYENGVSFGRGINEIPLTLLRNGTVTAVYLGKECAPGCDVGHRHKIARAASK